MNFKLYHKYLNYLFFIKSISNYLNLDKHLNSILLHDYTFQKKHRYNLKDSEEKLIQI